MGTFVPLLTLVVLLVHGALPLAVGVVLKTRSRYIVDASSGKRVKLACANWASHLDAMVTEGLSKQPLDTISQKVKDTGFNCVRLTWATYLMTNDKLGTQTVQQSFQSHKLTDAIKGVQTHNPSMLHLSLRAAFQKVVSSLNKYGVLVILDNHRSSPGWCCDRYDGNGFFKDKYFQPEEWITGLTRMAQMFRNSPNVVGMSLRNELRGPRQNLNDWYKYMQEGAEAVHAANPNVLVIFSGRDFDKDLSFLRNRAVQVSFTDKTVYEMHWYSFTDPHRWGAGNPSKLCSDFQGTLNSRGLFLLGEGKPVFMSEYGADQRGRDAADNSYMECFFSVAAEHDLDCSLWALQGSYYIRQGVVGLHEYYGVLNYEWNGVRNATFLKRVNALRAGN